MPGHSMTFRGPQRRAPGQSLPRTSPSGRGFKVSFPFSIGAEIERTEGECHEAVELGS